MAMLSQKHLFDLPDDIHYLNCAYMSPLMKRVQEAGVTGIQRKANPTQILPADFFNTANEVREKFAQIINGNANQIAIIPAVSYGVQNAVNNLPLNNGNHAITVGDEFPSDYYAIESWCKQHSKQLRIIAAPNTITNRGKIWNETILDAINTDTAVVILSSVHWTDGTLFNLQQIGERCRQMNARFIVDGTQSVGALPIDVKAFHIDALICAAYKWLMGPYSIGLAYYSEVFDNGIPIENAWVNRANAEDFSSLTSYNEKYTAGAGRYNVGQFGNHILLPMLSTAMQQIIDWNIHEIQNYCRNLIAPAITSLNENGYRTESEDYRCNHLFGFSLPEKMNKEELMKKFQHNKIFVSTRGNAVRVSPNVYNIPDDIQALIAALKH
jgi:selenocysteine lyase/cysteine desulfurase